MANLRNEFEFRSALLTALGQEHTEAEAKNEEMWRRKMLDGLGVEYDQNDVNQFGLFREKLIEGVTSKSEGGGGGSSDFSTAEVIIVGETQSVVDWQLKNSFPYVDNDELVATSLVEMGTYSAVLYKNSLTLSAYIAPTVTGSASLVEEGKNVYVVITGNCTITVPELI